MRGPPSLHVREKEGSAWWEGLMLRSRITGFSGCFAPALQPGITSGDELKTLSGRWEALGRGLQAPPQNRTVSASRQFLP